MQFSNVDFTTKEFDLDGNIHTYYRCNFTEVDLSGWDLRHFTFIECKFESTKLVSTCLDYAVFENCTLDGADLKNVRGQHTHFMTCELPNTDFYEAILVGAIFSRCNVTGASFRHANLSEVNLLHTKLVSTDLTGAALQFAIGNGAEVMSFAPSDEQYVVYTMDKVWLNVTWYNMSQILNSTLVSDSVRNFIKFFPATSWAVEKRKVKIIPLVYSKDNIHRVQLKVCLPVDDDNLLQASYRTEKVFCDRTLSANWGTVQIIEDDIWRCRDLMFSTTFPNHLKQIEQHNVKEIRAYFSTIFP